MVFPFKSLEAFNVKVSEEHEIFRRTLRDFLEVEVRPLVDKGEREGVIPKEIPEKMRDLGVYGLGIPQEYGGQGGDVLTTVIASEEISRVWPSLSARILVGGLFMIPVLKFGSDYLKQKYIPAAAKGEKVAAFANTEPDAGSDVAGIRTTAKRSGDKYVINGRKIYITNGGIADYLVVTARTSPPDPSARWKGISMFVVEKDTPGFSVVSRIETMGLRASNTVELAFKDVEVPTENLVGEEGMGFKYAMEAFDFSRPGVAAQGVGVGQAALERMVEYSTQRTAFNLPLAGFEAVQEKISETFTEVSSARLLTYWAATLRDRGLYDESIIAASMAKYYATEAAERAALRAISIYGGAGVTTSVGVERLLRDIEIMKVYEGTNDIQRLVIFRESARRLLGIRI